MVDLVENPNNSNNTETAAVQAVADLVGRAQQAGASDVHLQMDGATARVAFRLDGLMALVASVNRRVNFGLNDELNRIEAEQLERLRQFNADDE